MILNLANVERLRVAIHETPDERFDYRTTASLCGCVVPMLSRLFGRNYKDTILGMNLNETRFLYGNREAGFVGKDFDHMTASEATGANGKREALRRLSVILQQRYGSWRVPA